LRTPSVPLIAWQVNWHRCELHPLSATTSLGPPGSLAASLAGRMSASARFRISHHCPASASVSGHRRGIAEIRFLATSPATTAPYPCIHTDVLGWAPDALVTALVFLHRDDGVRIMEAFTRRRLRITFYFRFRSTSRHDPLRASCRESCKENCLRQVLSETLVASPLSLHRTSSAAPAIPSRVRRVGIPNPLTPLTIRRPDSKPIPDNNTWRDMLSPTSIQPPRSVRSSYAGSRAPSFQRIHCEIPDGDTSPRSPRIPRSLSCLEHSLHSISE